MKKRDAVGSLLVIVLILSFTSSTGESPSYRKSCVFEYIASEDLIGIKVAIFEGTASDPAVACRTAMIHMFQWMNATVEMINASSIKSGALWDYDILGLPPGNLPAYSVDLGTQGLNEIREFVNHGGSYFGIAGGAIFACDRLNYGTTDDEYMLKLFNGTANGPILGIEDQSISTFTVNTTNAEIDLTNIPSTMSTLFWGATFFTSDYMTNILPVASASGISNPSIIAYQFGSGCVFLSGLHPEFEENSDRDGTDFFDDLNDPDSEWPLMLKVLQWMVDESVWVETSITNLTSTDTSTMNDTLTQLDLLQNYAIIAAIVGVAVVLIVLIVLRVRKT